MSDRTYYSIASGVCAATASVCGKLSGSPAFEGPLFIFRILFFGLMILCNGGVWTLYAKALQESNTSLTPTVLSSASNYFVSAIVGILFFGEVTSVFWWSGMMFILFGLIFVAKDQNIMENAKKK